MLRLVCGDGDFRLLARYATEEMVLYRADREPPCVGREAVLAYERATAAGNRIMDVQQVIANDHFGAVLGNVLARRGEQRLTMPFCGLWRFVDGRIVEHWENAHDLAALRRFLAVPDTVTGD